MDGEIRRDVRRSMAGDRKAFERLIRIYSASIRGFLLRMVGDFHLSQDLTQETFLKAFTSLKSLDSPRCFRAWLFRIAFHVAVDYRRSRDNFAVSLDALHGRPIADPREADTWQIDEEDEREKQYGDVVQALATLPEHYGILVVLRYLQQRSHFEMARLLDLSLSNVKVRLYRARRMIRKRISTAESLARISHRATGEVVHPVEPARLATEGTAVNLDRSSRSPTERDVAGAGGRAAATVAR